MSLARAFTTRRARHTLEQKDKDGSSREGGFVEGAAGLLHRSKTTKAFQTHGSIRHKISGPVELTHTTNMLSYNAPDIFPQVSPAPIAVASSSSSKSSDDESDSGSTAPSSAGSTDASSPPTSPDSPYPKDGRTESPEPNHLSCYFTPPSHSAAQFDNSASPNGQLTGSTSSTTVDSAAPAIPKRAPSHTKKSYEGLARHRSTSRMSEQSSRSVSTKASFSFSRSSSSSTSTSVASHSSHVVKPTALSPPPIPTIAVAEQAPPVSHKAEYSETHPFGHELAKVSELVEEFGKEPAQQKIQPQPKVVDEEERELLQQGLKKFSAEDYLSEIHDLVAGFLADARPMAAPVWI